MAFLSQVKTAITKFTSVDKKLTEEEKNTALKQILDNALVAEGVTDVFALCGLDKPNIGLLSNEFLEDVRQMPYKNFAVELLEKLQGLRILVLLLLLLLQQLHDLPVDLKCRG